MKNSVRTSPTRAVLALAFACVGLMPLPAQTGAPPIEQRVIGGTEAIKGWSVEECTLEKSTAQTVQGRPALRWHVPVDHYAGEKKYPIGWPRITYYLKTPEMCDWSAWDFLVFRVYTDTSREKLPLEPAGFSLNVPDKHSQFAKRLNELKKGAWTDYRIPLAEIPNRHEVRQMQFHVSEANYKHGDTVDFYIDGLFLERYTQPLVQDFACESSVLFSDVKYVPVRFHLLGVKPGTEIPIQCEFQQDGKTLARTSATARPGIQRLSLRLEQAALKAGNYTLILRPANSSQTATAGVQIVASPWSK